MENKQDIKDLIQKFYPYAKDKLGFEHPVRVVMRQDAENAKDSLGKTAYYDPAEKLIVLYVTNRHPKDVLRSFSHELVHHAQNCRGDLDDLSTDGRYAEDGKGREIEAEAYLLGNGFLVRDWEDGNKQNEGVNKMKVSKSELKKIIQEELEKARKEKVNEKEDYELGPGAPISKQSPTQRKHQRGAKLGRDPYAKYVDQGLGAGYKQEMQDTIERQIQALSALMREEDMPEAVRREIKNTMVVLNKAWMQTDLPKRKSGPLGRSPN